MAINDAIKDILPASFRNVPFSVRKASVTGGRFNVIHEFPNSDRRFVEDMGLNNKSFTIDDAFVSGNDAQDKRDKLILALEQEGPGILVHPYFGDITVNAAPYTSSQSMTEVGVINFTLEFIFSGIGASTTELGGITTITPPGTGEVDGPSTLTPQGPTAPKIVALVASAESVVDKNEEVKKLCDKNIADNFSAKTENNNFQNYISKVLRISSDTRKTLNNFPFIEDEAV